MNVLLKCKHFFKKLSLNPQNDPVLSSKSGNLTILRTKIPDLCADTGCLSISRTKSSILCAFKMIFVLTVRSFGGRGESVGVEDTVQVVDLVLEDHCGETLHSVSNDLK